MPADGAPALEIASPGRVEVLNGCGVNKVALSLSVLLDRRRIRTLRAENAKHWNYQETLIRYPPGARRRALALAKIMDVPETRVSLQENLTSGLDLSIILGADHARILKAADRRASEPK